jgi:anti-anti-sigma regulatory factor
MTAPGLLGRLELGDHVCGLVDGAEDRLDVAAAVVEAGLAAGDRVMVFIDALVPAALVAGVEARGVAVRPAVDTGQVRVLPARTAYLAAGRFEPRPLLAELAGHVERAAADGYGGLRLVGDLGWVSDQPGGVQHLSWYEAEVNRLYLDGRALGVCLYDRHATDSVLLRRVGRAHPVTVSNPTAAGHASLLRIRRTRLPYGLRLMGEVDMSNRQAVAVAVETMLAEAPADAPVVIDVTGLRFADAATVAMMTQVGQRATGGAHLLGVCGAVETVVDNLGLDSLPSLRISRCTTPGTQAAELVG